MSHIKIAKSRIRTLFHVLLCLAVSVIFVNGQFVDLTRANNNTGQMGHDEWITQIVSTPDGKMTISAGIDGRVVLWDAVTGKMIREAKLPSMVLSLSLAGDGAKVAAGDATGTVSVIKIDTARVESTFAADKKLVNAVAWSEDGKFLAAGGPDGVVRIWSAAEQKVAREITPAKANISALAFAGSQLAIGLVDGANPKRSAEVWDWQSSKLIRTIDEGPAGLRAMTVSPDGKLLAIADFQKATLLNMVAMGDKGAELSLRVLPDSDTPTIVAIWDLTTGKRVSLIEAETGARSIAFSPDGQMLATAGVNGVMIFDIGNRLFTEIGRVDSTLAVDSVAFTTDSKHLLIGREREPIVKFGVGGIDKVIDPFFTAMIMGFREGINTGAIMPPDVGKLVTPVGNGSSPKSERSLTGGSTIEIWQIAPRTAAPDLKTFEAICTMFNDKPEEARKLLQQVIKDFPNYGDAQRLYAVFFESKDIKKVTSLLEASVKTDPKCLACWRSLGDVQFNTGNAGEAIKSYDQALKLRPAYGLVAAHQADAYAAVALTLMQSENTAKTMDLAKEALTKALMLRPGEERYYTNLAAAYYFSGDFDTDISLLITARKLRPDHARIFYNLGHAYRAKGDKKSAIDAYTRYIQMGEKGEETRVEKAKDFISELKK